jgi:hypothetical protein
MHKALARVVLVLLLAAFALPACAQTALSIERTGCVYREGDDTSWAATNLDESAWLPLAAWPGTATRTPYFWLRCRFQLGQLDPAIVPVLQVTGDLAYEIYIDGQFAGSFGNLSTGNHTVGEVRDYRSPALSQPSGTVVVALRIAFSPEILVTEPMPQLTLGEAVYQRGQYSEQVNAAVMGRWITWLCCGLIGAAGLFFFALFWFDRTQSYLLWAGLCWMCVAELRVNEFLHTASIPYPSRVEAFLYCAGQWVELCAVLLFFRLANRPLNWFYRVVVGILACTGAAYFFVAALPLRLEMALRWVLDASPQIGLLLQLDFILGAMSPLSAFWPLSKVPRRQLPIVCACFLWMVTDAAYLTALLPGSHIPHQTLLVVQQYRSVAILTAVATLTLFLIRRVRETNRERAMLAGEMQAARQIQQLLAPSKLDRAPGCDVEVVFLPAREVGGDFFLCRVLPDGRQRILLGDVSGKGAAAAMTAALLIGAAERRDADSPDLVLQHMNQVLCDCNVGGFATCLCADINPDGQLLLANAGQLPPYCNGKEIACDSALPLGLVATAEYAQSSHSLNAGDRLTVVSDGVVEARNLAGELFGFERTEALSTRTADQIAEAAEKFGQEDDITVLTLTFAVVEVLHA